MIWPDAQRALLDEHGGDRAAAAVELGFDDGTFGRAVRIGLEVEDFGLQQDGFEQLVEVGAVLGRDFDVEHFTAHGSRRRLRAAAVRCEPSAALAVGLSILLIATMIGTPAALAWLIDSIVCGITLSSAATTEDGNVGDLGTAGTHRGEGGVAGCVDEGDLAAVLLDLVGADMLGDAAGFAGDHVGMADGVEQRGLAVVDVTHDGDDRRTRDHFGLVVGNVEDAFFDVGFGDALDGMAEFAGDEFRQVGIDRCRPASSSGLPSSGT